MKFNVFPNSPRSLYANLVSLLTQYDAAMSKKASYNPYKKASYNPPYALGMHLKAASDWESDPETKSQPLTTLQRYFLLGRSEDPTDFCLLPVRKFAKTFLTADRLRAIAEGTATV